MKRAEEKEESEGEDEVMQGKGRVVCCEAGRRGREVRGDAVW